jgi:hypothetical protein
VEGGGGLATYTHDLSDPIAHEALEQSLRAKAEGLLGRKRAEGLWDAICNIETLPASALGMLLRG